MIQGWINTRPSLYSDGKIITPNNFEASMLKRSNSDPATFILSEYIMPEDKDQRQMIEKMSAKSRVLLNRLAAKTA